MLKDKYGSEAEGLYAQTYIGKISEDWELREKQSIVTNGIAYSRAYEYNQRKAINYAPPRNKNDDREVSLGLVHEKIVSFIAIFLKYVWKRRIKCYDEKGVLIKGFGEVYDLAIEFSYRLERLIHKISLIYWEVFTQGNAFVLEDWEVKMRDNPKAYKAAEEGGERVLVTPDKMDYTYEFLDGLSYEAGEPAQYRRAVSRVLDGRQVIFGNPEIEDIQEQPRITLEETITATDAEAMFGTLKRWSKVPKQREDINTVVGSAATTLFDASRHKDPSDVFILHRTFDKENNRFNVFLNGLMLLPSQTPMTVFYPSGNYPISNVSAERLRGSIYARAVPAKTKFNADFVDWALKMLANKFEQGIDPAILSNGKYTLTRDMFRGGQVTHGVKRTDYEKADPDNTGVTPAEFSFVTLLKEILESQTVNPTVSGEQSGADTLGQEQMLERNQRDKLGFLLDGLMLGFNDMAMRRAETVQSKYTIKQRETIVDGKKIAVYQNFTINISGVDNVVGFDEEVGTQGYDEEGKRDELFTKSFNDRKRGSPTEYYLVNPVLLREKKYILDIEIVPQKVKDTYFQMAEMWEDFRNRLQIFGTENNVDEMKKEYLDVSGKPDEIFTTQMYKKLDMETAAQMSGMPKPSVKTADKKTVNIR